MSQFGELYKIIKIVDWRGFQLPRDPNFNLLLTFNVSIPRAPLSVATYKSMLTKCVASGKYNTYIQSAAARTPNATALLHASSSSVTIGNRVSYLCIMLSMYSVFLFFITDTNCIARVDVEILIFLFLLYRHKYVDGTLRIR